MIAGARPACGRSLYGSCGVGMGWKGAIVEAPVGIAGRVFGKGPDPQGTPPREILVLRPNDLGDLLTATPVFDALRRRYPDARLIAGIGSWGRPIVENNPFVDEVVELDVPWNNKMVADLSWKAVARYLAGSPQIAAARRPGGFAAALDLLGSHVGAALMLRLGVRHRVGIRGYRGGWSACQQYTRFSPDVHVAAAALRQAALLGATDQPEARPQLYPTGEERAEAARLWGAGTALRILVGTGGGLEEKCWPPELWSAALRELPNVIPGALDIVLVGGPADRRRAATVLGEGIAGARSLCGDTSLRVTFALAEQADLVLCNASMLLHVAAAFRRPTVAVLGGMHVDRAGHDRLWGYSPPYSSVGPAGPSGWPSVREVLDAVAAGARALGTAPDRAMRAGRDMPGPS